MSLFRIGVHQSHLRVLKSLSAGLLAVGITLLMVSFQSVKAALANPVTSLRSE